MAPHEGGSQGPSIRSRRLAPDLSSPSLQPPSAVVAAMVWLSKTAGGDGMACWINFVRGFGSLAVQGKVMQRGGGARACTTSIDAPHGGMDGLRGARGWQWRYCAYLGYVGSLLLSLSHVPNPLDLFIESWPVAWSRAGVLE